jgi:hypothetical protein
MSKAVAGRHIGSATKVDVNQGRVELIGGTVRGMGTKRIVNLNSDGLLERNAMHSWIVVMSR